MADPKSRDFTRPQFMKDLRALCKKHGVHFDFDDLSVVPNGTTHYYYGDKFSQIADTFEE